MKDKKYNKKQQKMAGKYWKWTEIVDKNYDIFFNGFEYFTMACTSFVSTPGMLVSSCLIAPAIFHFFNMHRILQRQSEMFIVERNRQNIQTR